MAINHRVLGKTGENVSQLGFGCMRLPVQADGKVDFPLAEKMLDYAYEQGVNYFDTAYPYHGGESEVVVGRILGKYPRESFYLTTKLMLFEIHTIADAEKLFATQMERLQLGYIDNYYFHGINRDTWEGVIKPLGLLDFMQELKSQGKIRHIGFSFHDEYELFEEVIESFPWELCQIQYNYMDNKLQAGDRGVRLCGRKGIPMVIMEPVKGGGLAQLPEESRALLQAVHPEASEASWALRWVASHPEIFVTLSGMSTMEQVEDNIRTFSDFQPVTEQEKEILAQVREKLEEKQKIGCTGCRYCQPCPNGVDIPGCFRVWNEASMFPQTNAKRSYQRPGRWQARYCEECGECEKKCPQHLPIRQSLKEVERLFG